MIARLVLVLIALGTTAGCSMSMPSSGFGQVLPARQTALARGAKSIPIKHVVFIIQENRTVDNLFQHLPGANTVSHGFNFRRKRIKLRPISLTDPFDLSHVHGYWLRE